MDALITALSEANVLLIALSLCAVLVSSSVASTLVAHVSDSRRESKAFRREVRSAALESIGTAYVCYLGSRAADNPRTNQTPLSIELSVHDATASVLVATARIGNHALLTMMQEFTALGSSYAVSGEDASKMTLTLAFHEAITAISSTIPET